HLFRNVMQGMARQHVLITQRQGNSGTYDWRAKNWATAANTLKKINKVRGVRKMARPARFERATAWFVARYSIQLSYGRAEGAYYIEASRDCQRIKGKNSDFCPAKL